MNRPTNTTRMYPRNLQQAFGPYTSNDLQPMPEPRNRHRQDWCIYLLACIALAVILYFQP